MVPTDTDDRIRRLCTQISSATGDAEIKGIVRKLRATLKEHVARAKSSLATKGSVIRKMDPDAK
ncbi:MAG: hypothetical protein ABSB87_13100 [Terriglobales bacterium]|jgi:hypothetical protein